MRQALSIPIEVNMISRKQAKERGLKRYFTGSECKYGHISERLVSTRQCIECKQVERIAYQEAGWFKRYRKKNIERLKASNKEWAEQNSDHIAAYRLENRGEILKARAEYRRKNRSLIRQHYHNNKGAYVSYVRKRQAAKLDRTLPGHDQDIKEIYIEARQLTEKLAMCVETDEPGEIEMHVDHIVPMQGKEVSGLHVPWNLQIVSAAENRSKGNRLCPDTMIG